MTLASGTVIHLATGLVDGVVITVAFTERGDCIRIISARKANSDEKRAYYQGQTP